MENKHKFESKLTPEEIDKEVAKLGDFFKQIPDDLKATAAMHLILEVVNQGSRDYFQAIGIFDEAKNAFRDMALSIKEIDKEMDDERDLLRKAYESALYFRCIQELEWREGYVITVGEIHRIGYVGEDAGYSGGQRYEVFQEDGKHFSICQNRFLEHFEEVDDVN